MSAAENVGKGEDVERLLQQLDELERAGDDFFTRMQSVLDLPSEEKVRNIDLLLERATALSDSLTKSGMATLSQSEVPSAVEGGTKACSQAIENLKVKKAASVTEKQALIANFTAASKAFGTV